VKLWRISRRAFFNLDGEGARLYGGRWNSEGLTVVYLSTSFPLAVLEYLVHVDIKTAPSDLIRIEVDVPDATSRAEVSLKELPADWNATSDHPSCVDAGDAWIRGGSTCLLFVPSAVVPTDLNVLMNPVHPDAKLVRAKTEPFILDRRLLE
jgi:RES domain-containing protein